MRFKKGSAANWSARARIFGASFREKKKRIFSGPFADLIDRPCDILLRFPLENFFDWTDAKVHRHRQYEYKSAEGEKPAKCKHIRHFLRLSVRERARARSRAVREAPVVYVRWITYSRQPGNTRKTHIANSLNPLPSFSLFSLERKFQSMNSERPVNNAEPNIVLWWFMR